MASVDAVTGRSEEEVRLLYLEWRAKHRPIVQDALDLDADRFEVFKDNLRRVDEHNAAADRGEHSFRLAINQFADLTNEEFRARYLGNFSRRKRPATQSVQDQHRGDDSTYAEVVSFKEAGG
ncbi:oryzain alpha chain-like [Zingiber officinale]|uniref:oryzain alpha chain-like n=1 Tax=Zingiber officinale TaxID=94328 RepID=UPI001C4D23D2|nr:oryzain alpha chain-like [Zingiber officinale]